MNEGPPIWDVDRQGTAILGRDGRVISADDRTRALLSGAARVRDVCADDHQREALDRALRSLRERARLELRVRAGAESVTTEWTFSLARALGDEAEDTVVAQWMRCDELASLRGEARSAIDRAERLRLLLEAIPDPIFLKDGAGRWLEVNEPALSLFGLTGVDYRGRTDEQLSTCSPEGGALLTCIDTDERAWRRRTITQEEEVVPQPDGTTRYYDTYKVPMFRRDGSRRGLVVLGRDVTDRRRAELALEARERHWRTILDATLDAIFVIDGEERFAFLNPAAERILAADRAELLGMRWTDAPFRLEDAEGRPVAPDTGPIAGVRERTVHGELTVVRADGSRVVISFNATPLDEPGRPIVIAAQDVTARAEIAALKSAFLRVAAHELRTPLTPLRLLVQQARVRAARGEPVDPRALERVERQTDRLTRLVEDLVAFVRVERGVLPIHPQPLDLRTVAAATVEDFRDVTPGRDLRLVAPSAPLDVVADPMIIELVLANLIDNALKYTEGEVEVRLSAGRDSVRVAVRDRGAGIPEGQRANLFNPFYRAGSEATTRHGGLGLGLALAREAVRRHGGELVLTTTEGNGSTFWFDLPRAPR